MSNGVFPARAAKAARNFLMNLSHWWSDELDYRDARSRLQRYEAGFDTMWMRDDPEYLRNSERWRKEQRAKMRRMMEPDGYHLCAAARAWDLSYDAIMHVLSGWRTDRMHDVDVQAKAVYHRAQIERAAAGEPEPPRRASDDPRAAEIDRRCDERFADILAEDRWMDDDTRRAPATSPVGHERKREKATAAAWAYIHAHASPLDITCVELAAVCECSPSLIVQLPPWKDLMAKKRKNKNSAKTVRLTRKMENVVGATDESVEDLIAEQEADAEPSSLDRKKAKVYARR